MAPKRAPQRKEWMFTVQTGNLTVEDSLDLWEQAIRNVVPNGVNYLVFQQEVSPTTSTVHIQGFVAMSQKKRPDPMGQLFRVQPESFQGTDGTPAQNRGYCTDDDKRAPAKHAFEWGTMPGGQGKRTDLDAVNTLLKQGQGTKRAIEDLGTTYLRYPSGCEKVGTHWKAKRCKNANKLEVSLYVIWGTPGSSKTTWAKAFDPGNSYLMPDPVKGATVWMGSYDGERTLIIEDYDGEYPYGTLKRMCDGTYTEFQTKGSHAFAEWDAVVITSNFHPREWYPKQREDVWIYDQEQGYPGPLQRRITNLVQFEGVWPDVTCTLDGTVIEGFPPTREAIRSAPETSQAPSYSANAPSYRAPSPAASAPESPPPDIEAQTEIDATIASLLGELPAVPVSPTDSLVEGMGANFLDDSQLDGIVFQPGSVTTFIPPGWEDAVATEVDTRQEREIVW